MNNVIGALQWKLPRAPYPLIRLCAGRIWTELMEKNWGIFVTKRLHFSNNLDFILDLDFTFEK